MGVRTGYCWVEGGVLLVGDEEYVEVDVALAPEYVWVVLRGGLSVSISGEGARVEETKGDGA